MFATKDLGGGRWEVSVENTPFVWTTFASTRGELDALLRQQEPAWKRRLAPLEKIRGAAMKQVQNVIFARKIADRKAKAEREAVS